MVKKIYNLNNLYGISLKNFPNGRTQNIEIKIGRKWFYMDIGKNYSTAFVQLYPRISPDRKSFSKYDADLISVKVKNDALLTKEFLNIDNLKAVQKAQQIINKWYDIMEL